MSIRAKLLSLILLVSFIPILIIGYFNYSNFKSVVEDHVRHDIEAHAEDKKEKVELFLFALQTRVEDMASDGFIRDSLQRFQEVQNTGTIIATARQHLLENKMPIDEKIIAIDLLDESNVTVISTAEYRVGIQYSKIMKTNLRQQGIVFSDLFLDGINDVASIEVLAPVFSRTDKNKRIGSFLVRFDVSSLSQVISIEDKNELFQVYADHDHDDVMVSSYLVNGDGLMLTRLGPEGKKPFSIKVDSQPVAKCFYEGAGENGAWQDYRGVEVLGNSTCIEFSDFRWVMLSEIEVSDAYAPIYDYQDFFGVMMLLVLLLIMGLSLYLTRLISAPIKTLSDGVKQITNGNLSFTVGSNSKDEIGELSRSFDLMLTAIKQSKHEIEDGSINLSKLNKELSYVKEAMDQHAIIVETDKRGVITRVNQKFCDITQYSVDEIVGQTHRIINSGYHPRQFFENLWRTIASGKVWHGDICNRRKDGEIYWVNTTIVPYLNKDGGIERYIALRTDITEQKQSEKYLLRFNRRLLASANIEKVILDAVDEMALLSGACKVLVQDGGYSRAWVGYAMHDAVKSVKAVAQFGYVGDFFETVKVGWGDDELGSGPIGNTIRSGTEMVIRNIATSKEFAPWYEAVSVLGTKGVISLPLRDGNEVFGVISVHTSEQNVFDVDEVALLKRLADDVAYGVVNLRAKRDRDRAEKALEKSEENLKRAQVIAQLGSWEQDLVSGKYEWSDELYYLLGHKPGDVKPSCEEILKMVCVAERDQVATDLSQAIENAVSCNMEFSITKPDGELRYIKSQLVVYVGADGKAERVAGTLLDITDQKRSEMERESLQNQLMHAQKLDSIGQLTGGVAHDFNNILSSIMGYTSLAIEECPESNTEFLEYLNEVSKAGTRAKELISQLMAFSRRETKEAEVLSLEELTTEAFNMLKPAIPAAVELTLDIEDDLPLVRANAVQIHQILTNLIINAADAIQEFGRVDIRLHTRAMTDSVCTSCQQSFSGNFIELSVTDNGSGISEQDLVRMFEPFFTTKELGKGTGMGLAMVHGLLHSHDGHVQVRSNPGQGSCFSLFFPCEYSKLESKRPVIETTKVQTDKERSGNILIVDDEVQISKMICSLLTRRGYQCAESNSPEDALQLFGAEPSKFDLIVTDQMMPVMTGMEMASLILEKRPDMPILLCTGYSGKLNNSDVEKAGLKAVIDKPINLERLVGMIDSLVESQNEKS